MRSSMATLWLPVLLLATAIAISSVDCNAEVDILHAWKLQLIDPNKALESWDPTLPNPCLWLHVTCNSQDTVVRLDIQKAGLSGHLSPQLAMLPNLQWMVLYGNKLSGSIPPELGTMKKLVGLYLYKNRFTGPIPSTLADSKSLRYLRLNNNNLEGKLPIGFLNRAYTGDLRILDVSRNQLSGTVPANNSYELVITKIIQDPKSSSFPLN